MPNSFAPHIWLGHTLSPYLQDLPLAPPPEMKWPTIINYADSWVVLPNLLQRAKDIMPEEASEICRIVYDYECNKSQTLKDQIIRLTTLFNAAGIEPVLLKGAERLFQQPYQTLAPRRMLDIDIFFPDQEDQKKAIEVLKSSGYAQETKDETANRLGHHFLPFFKENEPARIELHYKLVPDKLSYFFDQDMMIDGLETNTHAGAHFKTLSKRDGLILAYVQSTHMATPRFSAGTSAGYKWIDFLERAYFNEINFISDISDFTLASSPQTKLDNQFLTLMHDVFGFPYFGTFDRGFYDRWHADRPVLVRYLDDRFAAADLNTLLSARRWRNLFRNFHQHVADARRSAARNKLK